MRRSLAVRRPIGKARRAPSPLLRERHTLAQIRRGTQFSFVRRSKIGKFESFDVTSPKQEVWTRTAGWDDPFF